jgi:hypothetical protein
MYQLMAEQVEQENGLAISHLCQAFSLSRANYYRWQQRAEPLDSELELRDQIQRIVLEMPGYGYRRVTQELERRGLPANHKRVLRLMRQDNLLCLRKRSFVRTTDLPGRRPRCLQPPVHRLGPGPNSGGGISCGGTPNGSGLSPRTARPGAPFGSRRAVCLGLLHAIARSPWHPHQHEPAWQSV